MFKLLRKGHFLYSNNTQWSHNGECALKWLFKQTLNEHPVIEELKWMLN